MRAVQNERSIEDCRVFYNLTTAIAMLVVE
jgi:hypothetical protein